VKRKKEKEKEEKFGRGRRGRNWRWRYDRMVRGGGAETTRVEGDGCI
jgi:hypothetical protein